MGWIFDESVLSRASELADELVEGLAANIPSIRNFMALAEAVSALEEEFERARQNLKGLHLRGLASSSDYAGYEQIRKNLHSTQLRFVRLVRELFADQPAALRHIPAVRKPPAISQTVLGYALPSNAGGGLGAAPVAVAAATIPVWMVGAIILALIAAAILVVIAVIVTVVVTGIIGGLAAESLRDVTLTHQQLEAHTSAQQARLEAFEHCLDALGDAASATARTLCRLEAMGLVPPPPIIAAEVPRPGDWVPWVVGGVIFIGVLGAGLYVYSVRKGAKALSGSKTYNLTDPSRSGYRRLSREEALYSEDIHSLDVE